jgi:FkbM family methyltransferase
MPLRRIASTGWATGRSTPRSVRACAFIRAATVAKERAVHPDARRDRARRAAAAIDRQLAEGRLHLVDIGANVSLYSLLRRRSQARILAAEPQPGIVDRLLFNLRANAGFEVRVVAIAVADREGEIELVIDNRDSGGTRLNKGLTQTGGAETVRVQCRPLAAILQAAGISAIDALKIDIEGAEDLALAPFLRAAAPELLPRLLLIEDRPSDWAVDLYALFRQRGYAVAARSRHNVVWRLP